jgi:hypothetical protein
MGRSCITANSRGVKTIVAIVVQSSGIRTADVLSQAGYSRSYGDQLIGFAHSHKFIESVFIDKTRKWFSPEMAQSVKTAQIAAHEAKMAAKAAKPLPMRAKIRMMLLDEDGASVAKAFAIGCKRNSASRHICMLVDRGQAFKARREGARTRWFATQADADKWAFSPPLTPSEWVEPRLKGWRDHPARKRRLEQISAKKEPPKKPAKKPAKHHPPVILTKSGNDAPVVIKDRSVSFREREATHTEKTKVTIINRPHQYRWQSVPDSGVSIFADHPGYGA